jgi:hypothetical protein
MDVRNFYYSEYDIRGFERETVVSDDDSKSELTMSTDFSSSSNLTEIDS